MTYVLVTDTTAKRLTGNPTLTSLDGEERCTFGSIRDSSPARLGAFGVYDVDTAPPEGQRWTGQFDGTVTPPVAIFVALDPDEELAKERAAMSCSRMQGILTLGEEKWGEVLAYRETATWAEKIIIDDSGQWERVSENIEFIGYLVGYDDEQMDDLFRAAMQVQA